MDENNSVWDTTYNAIKNIVGSDNSFISTKDYTVNGCWSIGYKSPMMSSAELVIDLESTIWNVEKQKSEIVRSIDFYSDSGFKLSGAPAIAEGNISIKGNMQLNGGLSSNPTYSIQNPYYGWHSLDLIKILRSSDTIYTDLTSNGVSSLNVYFKNTLWDMFYNMAKNIDSNKCIEKGDDWTIVGGLLDKEFAINLDYSTTGTYPKSILSYDSYIELNGYPTFDRSNLTGEISYKILPNKVFGKEEDSYEIEWILQFSIPDQGIKEEYRSSMNEGTFADLALKNYFGIENIYSTYTGVPYTESFKIILPDNTVSFAGLRDFCNESGSYLWGIGDKTVERKEITGTELFSDSNKQALTIRSNIKDAKPLEIKIDFSSLNASDESITKSYVDSISEKYDRRKLAIDKFNTFVTKNFMIDNSNVQAFKDLIYKIQYTNPKEF